MVLEFSGFTLGFKALATWASRETPRLYGLLPGRGEMRYTGPPGHLPRGSLPGEVHCERPRSQVGI